MSAARNDPRPSGIPAIGELPWGSHFAVFHTSGRDLLDVLVPFVAAGLERNELCSWEVDAPLTVGDVTGAIARVVPEIGAYLASGQLEIVSASAPTAHPEEDERVELLLDRAMLAGRDGVRLVRHGAAGADRGISLGESIGRLNVIAAVAYPRAERGVLDLMRRVQDHRCALVCNSGRWEVLQGSEARAVHEALRRSQDKLQLLFRNMSEGFAYHRIVRDGRGRPCDYVFLEVNPAFERLTGLSARDVIGRRATQVIPGIEADPTDWIGRYGRVALMGEPVQFESHAAAFDRWYAVSAFSSQRGYFAVTFADVTERRQSRRSLQEANERLQEADRRKDEFLGVLSHELRNPLAPIRNAAYILRRAEPGTEQTRRAQAIIERQTEHLTRLVDDLLDITRITRGKIELRRSRVDLREVVSRAAEDFRALLDHRGTAFRLDLPPASLWAEVDPTRINQILGTLRHTAAKFTSRGDVVSRSLQAAGPGAEVRVRDTGAGIDGALLPHVFDAFVQGERTLARSEGGLGLGLALVKGIAELHGGSVRAESAGKGQGAAFTVLLPLAEDMLAPGRQRATARPRGPDRRVLVVDDNRDAAESLADVVRMLGHAAEVAFDGPSAVVKARAHQPDLVLCDIGLPGMSGYDVARTLRAGAMQGTQLIALSGYAQPEDVRRAIEAGFDGHVAKPCDLEDIERLLG